MRTAVLDIGGTFIKSGIYGPAGAAADPGDAHPGQGRGSGAHGMCKTDIARLYRL